uniref:Pentatricopeptide repeat-containing protein At5g57250, mitochondrial n=1 Tax=Anthurium amnicola TaxID=1678845 RepID=A0A1D1XVL6_9ARAE
MQALLKRGFRPTLCSVNLFLSSLFRAGKYQLLLHVFSQLSSNSVRTDPRTETLVARALLKSGRFEEAEDLIARRERCRLSGDRGLWDALIQGVCVAGEDPDKGFALLRECVGRVGVRPCVHTFRSLVFSFSSRGRMDGAIEVVEAMVAEKVGYPVDNYVCSSIISGFCKVGKPELALGFFDDVRKGDGFAPNLVTYTAVVDALCRDGRIGQASDLVQRMQNEGVVADAVLYDCWAHGHIKNVGGLQEALLKHRLMVESGIKPDVVNYTILSDGFCKEGNVEKVVGFLNEMVKCGLEPNLITYTTVIQGFCKRGKLKEATDLLRKLEDVGIPMDEFVYATLINGFCKKGDLEEVFKLLAEMERKGIEVGVVTYNMVIDGMSKEGNLSEANELLLRFDGDIITYSTLICGYLREKDVLGVLETKKRMEEAGICMDVVGCNILIKAYLSLGMFEDAWLLFRRMPEMGLEADSVTYSIVVNGCCKVRMVDKAFEVIDECRSTSLEPNIASFNCILIGLCKQGMSDIATKVFCGLNLRGLTLKPITHRLLMKAIYKEDQGEGVLKLLCSLDESQPDLHSLICNDAIAFLCNKSCLEIAMQLYMLARKKNLIVSIKSYHILLKNLFRNGNKHLISLMMSTGIKEYGLSEPRVMNILSLFLCKYDVEKALQFLNWREDKSVSSSVSTAIVDSLKGVGRIKDAYDFLMEGKGNGTAVDVVTYSIVVDGLCKEGYLEMALTLCTEMRNRGVKPNIFTYNSVINGLCQQGCLVEAFRLFDSLKPNNLIPTVVTYGTLINALSREGYLEDAKELFVKMIQNGVTPSLCVYNLLINGYCRFGLVEEAQKLLLHLEKSSMRPDAFTVSSVVNGFCVQGDMEGALGFYMEYKRRGITLDFLGFFSLIKGLCAKGRLEEARTLMCDMLQCQSVTDIINKAGVEIEGESLVSLLGFLCEHGRIEDAISVLSEVGSLSFTAGRFIGNHRHNTANRLYGVKLENFDKEAFCSPLLKLPEKTGWRTQLNYEMFGTDGVNLGLHHGGGRDSRIDDIENLVGRCKFRDFDVYYPVIASLCSKGDLGKASTVLKHVLMNSGECS